jgi:hypothetical protein
MKENKDLKQCPYCGEDILKVATKCKHCGSDLTKLVQADGKLDRKAKNANSVALLGGALVIIGLFLPWMSSGKVSLTCFQKFQESKILFALGIAIFLLGIVDMNTKKDHGFLIVLYGLASLLFLSIIYFQMIKVGGGTGAPSPQIGSGFYISGIGAFIGIIGGFKLAQKPKEVQNHMICTFCKEVVVLKNMKCPRCNGNTIVTLSSDEGKKILAKLMADNPEKYKKIVKIK